MPIEELRIRGYRSIQEFDLKLGPVNVLVGANGCGKTNLYRAVHLLWHAANGTFSRSISEEGGFKSALWAGSFASTAALELGLTLDEISYDLTCGRSLLKQDTMFSDDPVFKNERINLHEKKRKIVLLERGPSVCTIRNAEGQREQYLLQMHDEESVLSQVSDPHRYPQLTMVRNRLLRMRFYHGFRTDAESPLRRPQPAPRTPILSHDGRDLAAALATIMENGDDFGLMEKVAEAFSGGELEIHAREGLVVSMRYPGFKRSFSAAELSDGTLRYLCLLAALKSPSPAPILALNEPETSLHPDLIEPLARLIAEASAHFQIWITTHSNRLAEWIEKLTGAAPIRLEKIDGATRIQGWRRGSYRFD
jgi:predicted ATPase